jgi:CSLREA domain-containing protein
MIALVAAAGLAAPAGAAAATITVNTTVDEFATGQRCSLREAVWSANNNSNAQAPGCRAGSGIDTIDLRAGTFALTRSGPTTAEDLGEFGDLDVSESLQIVHRGLLPATIRSQLFGERVFHVVPGSVVLRLQGLTIDGGSGMAVGGGILNSARLILDGSTIFGGSAGSGGGIATFGGITDVRNSTIYDNSAQDDGGGLWVGGGEANLRNATVTRNRTRNGDGAGIFAFSSGVPSRITLSDTLLAGNLDAGTEAHDCARIGGAILSRGQNLIGNTNGCGYQRAGGDIINRSAKVIELGNFGGPTPTVNLRKSSPAINAATGCLSTDQRGVPRRLGGPRCDIGAWELTRCRGVVVNRVGTNSSELLLGTSSADGVLALGGADTVRAMAGRDGLCGGGGPDRLEGGGGFDVLDGGPNRDTCVPGRGRSRLISCELRGRIW